MKREELIETVKQLKETYYERVNFDLIYLCSNEAHYEDLGFEFKENKLIEFDYCCENIEGITIHVIRSDKNKHNEKDELRIIPKSHEPIRVRFE